MNENIKEHILIIILIGSCLFTGFMFNEVGTQRKYYAITGEVSLTGKGDQYYNIVSQCNRTSNEYKLDCIVDSVPFNYTGEYHFGVYPAEYTLEKGGICKDYSNLYVSLAEDLGMEGYEVIIKNSYFGNLAHSVAIITYEEEGLLHYCLIDNPHYVCNTIQL